MPGDISVHRFHLNFMLYLQEEKNRLILQVSADGPFHRTPGVFSLRQIHMKTMPAAMFRLLTGQETPMYI